jgi:SNF2 family DNA or RNA helicase
MEFKTKPYRHQLDAYNFAKDREFSALFMEQGTGKTKVALDVVAHNIIRRHVKAVIIIAPKGVHTNWLNREIPKHLSNNIEANYLLWNSAKTKKNIKAQEFVLKDDKPFFLFINIDALITKAAKELIAKIIRRKTMVIVDESSRIKTPSAKRTKEIVKLGANVAKRLILTGTPVTQSPFDVYAQFKFLSPTIFHKSYLCFKHKYGIFTKKYTTGGATYEELLAYQNLDLLKAEVKKHAFIITKEECLDLPAKVYQVDSVELSNEQKKHYTEVQELLRTIINDDELLLKNTLTQIIKLQQITSGFLKLDDETHIIDGINPKLKRLEERLEESTGKVIIWTRFKAEVDLVASLLNKNEAVFYTGETSKEDREQAVVRFQTDDTCRYFVGNPSTAGLGLTLTAASTVIYYSNSFSLEDRLQSEDRAHRIGQDKSVLYIDLVAKDTIDEQIKRALEAKESMAKLITEKKFLAQLTQ